MIEHSFNTFLAQKYGIDVAIFIKNMVLWTATNASKEHNFHQDRYWSWGTPESFQKYFSYWKPRTVKAVLKKCFDEGLILKGNFNKHKYDRTNWYALSDKALSELNLDKNCLQPAPALIRQNLSDDSDKSCPMVQTKSVQPIPDTKTDTKTDIYTPYNPPTKKQEKEPEILKLDDLKKDNPHSLPEQALKDWTINRKKKKAPITPTVWKKVNKTLGNIYQRLGIKPEDAFEEMVASNWQSIKIEYFENKRPKRMTLEDVINPMGKSSEPAMYDLVHSSGHTYDQE